MSNIEKRKNCAADQRTPQKQFFSSLAVLALICVIAII
jgi:hypothetical protein